MNLKNVNDRMSQIGIKLESAAKLEGGKIKSPQETFKIGLKSLESLSPPIDFKIVEIHNHDFLDIPVHQVRSKLISNGKGLNEDFSKASAIMEFVERYSWDYFISHQQENMIFASMDELGNIGFSEGYFINNLADSATVKNNFSKIRKIKMRWVKAYSISKNRFIWYPLSWHNAVNSSNGLASGNSFTEAIVQAICETVERHTYSRIAFSNRTLPTIKVDCSRWSRAANLIEKFELGGLSLVLKNMTNEIKIPSVLALAPDNCSPAVNNACGMGTHINPEDAVIRAITECAQVRAQMLDIKSHFAVPKTFDEYFEKMQKKACAIFNTNEFYERMDKNSEIVESSQIEALQSNDILSDLKLLISLLEKESHEIFVVNKTHPKLSIPTVRIFIPTLKYYVLTSDIPVSLDSILARIYLDTADIDNAIIYLQKTGHEFFLEMADILQKLKKSGISNQECIAKLGENLKTKMVDKKAKYRLSEAIVITENPRYEQISLFNSKSGLHAKIRTVAFNYLKMLEEKPLEEVLMGNQNLEEFDEDKFLVFIEKLLMKGFLGFVNN